MKTPSITPPAARYFGREEASELSEGAESRSSCARELVDDDTADEEADGVSEERGRAVDDSETIAEEPDEEASATIVVVGKRGLEVERCPNEGEGVGEGDGTELNGVSGATVPAEERAS